MSQLFLRFTGVIVGGFCHAIAQNDQLVMRNTEVTKLLLYRSTYVIWGPPTQNFQTNARAFLNS